MDTKGRKDLWDIMTDRVALTSTNALVSEKKKAIEGDNKKKDLL